MASLFQKENKISDLNLICGNCFDGESRTFLNASRVHSIFPKPRRYTGSCVPNMKIKTILCISMGNKYQSHWYSSKSMASNWPFIASPNSQKKKMMTNDQVTKTNGKINSTGFKCSCDYGKRDRKIYEISLIIKENWIANLRNRYTQLIAPKTKTVKCKSSKMSIRICQMLSTRKSHWNR